MWYYTNSSLESSTGKTYWWSLSPVYWYGVDSRVWLVRGSALPGYLNYNDVNIGGGVRPAVSLKTCVQWKSGNGTSETPYEIAETSSGC